MKHRLRYFQPSQLGITVVKQKGGGQIYAWGGGGQNTLNIKK